MQQMQHNCGPDLIIPGSRERKIGSKTLQYEVGPLYKYKYIYIYILDSHRAPYGACEFAQRAVRSTTVIARERKA